MVLVNKEGINQHPELTAELPGVETKYMIPGQEVAENVSSYYQRAATADRNANINNSITGVPKIMYEAPEVVKY